MPSTLIGRGLQNNFKNVTRKTISQTAYFTFYLFMPEDSCDISLYLPRVFFMYISMVTRVLSQKSLFSSDGEQIASCVYVGENCSHHCLVTLVEVICRRWQDKLKLRCYHGHQQHTYIAPVLPVL